LVWVPTVIQMVSGWRAVRDDAMISIGSYRVFSSHTPTVGAWSQASQGTRHAFFDLGPLLFWLLAVPVRLDPNQGAIWGAALLCGAALSLAVEAGWAVKGWPAGVAIALVAADVGWRTQIFADLVWNPHFGLVFIVAAGAAAWTVASGRFGWWPPLVLFSSVAAQCHLAYAFASIALTVVAPIAALVFGRRPSRWRWIFVGAAVGVACWALPLLQQVFGHPGNVTLILRSGSTRARVGLGFGLHAVAAAVAARPIWLSMYPFASVPQYLEAHRAVWGVLALCALAAVAIVAWLAKRIELAALGVICFVLTIGTAVSFAAIPKDDVVVVAYLADILWVVGAMAWIVFLWAFAELTMSAFRRIRRHELAIGSSPHLLQVLEVAALALLAIAGVEGVRTLVPSAHNRSWAVQQDRPLDDAIARSVERSVPRGPVVVNVRPTTFGPAHGYYNIDYWGVAFDLLTAGWQPGLSFGFYGTATNLSVPPATNWPEVTVTVDPSDKAITSVRRTRA